MQIRRLAALDPVAWLSLALVLAAGCAMFVRLGAEPLWVDEAIAALPALSVHDDLLPNNPFDLDFMPWQLEDELWDPATPLYRYALGLFTAITGFTEFTARSFSVLMALLCAVPLFSLARTLYGPRAAWLTIAFFVTSPTLMLFAREARHFTFVLFLALCTLHQLLAAAEERTPRAAGLWFVALVATLLSQTLGYGILPIVGLYVLLNGPKHFVKVSSWPWYLGAGAVYLAIMAAFWNTLPFFHITACENRPAGCQHDPFYYLAVLFEFLSPMTNRHLFAHFETISLAPVLFLIGFGFALRDVRDPSVPRSRSSLALLWFLAPLLLLSVPDVKFPRYLFIWSMPVCALFVATAVDRIARAARLRRWEFGVVAALALIVVFSPRFRLEHYRALPGAVHSGLLFYARNGLLDAPDDNFERIRWQTAYLEERMGPDDVVVSSFDDGSLGFHLDRFVYGFLASRRTDEFFLELLAETERKGGKVWFMDTLPTRNYCLSDEPEPRSVDCRQKFRGFYEACLTVSACGDVENPCMHVPVP